MRYRRYAMVLALCLCAASALAQVVRGVVVDQTGLMLPGVRLEVLRGGTVRSVVTSGPDGTFEFPDASDDDVIVAALDGFETTRVATKDAGRIVMPLARATEHASVTASPLTSSGSTMERLGSALAPETAQRMPMARPRAVESLPLLPSVVRGPDGLLRLDGTRPHEASLWIDGFDVTDPVTGTSPIDLPLESVKEIAVLHDPMAATFGGMLGALASIETAAGGDQFRGGVQSFIPHPRLSRQGLGRIQGFFPRAYASGRMRALRYVLSQEYDFERIPVPGVTTRAGRPAIGEVSATSFARFDVSPGRGHKLTIEGIFVPGHAVHAGMTPLRPASTSPTVRSRDLFAGVIDRIVVSRRDVVTIRVAALVHDLGFGKTADDPDAHLTPAGWRGSWFASIDRRADRRSVALAWDRTTSLGPGAHTITLAGGYQLRTMRAAVAHHPVRIEDTHSKLVRLIDFGPSAPLTSSDGDRHIVVRDRWMVTDRWEIDGGARVDADGAIGDRAISPRLGARYLVTASGSTVVKAGIGRFVGQIPLHALSFSGFATRTDTSFNPTTGDVETSQVQRPTLGALRLPRADSLMLEVEQRLGPGLDAQLGIHRRTGTALPTVNVAPGREAMELASSGDSRYHEVALTVRQTWGATDQIFFSYVRSASRGELNDFSSLFRDMTTAHLEPGGRSISAADTPNRFLLWGTLGLPHGIVVSPAGEWHTGFPYSPVDLARHYAGAPNGERLPGFFSLDTVAYKTVSVRDRNVNLGVQLFNLTRHFNPRNVMTVAGTPHFKRGVNSVGMTVAGYMMVKWQ